MNAHATTMSREDVIGLLEERDTLLETVRQLQEALAPIAFLPPAWHLTRKEDDLLRAMRAVGGNVLHRERAMLALYGVWEDAPDQKVVDVMVCKLRRKLAVAGAQITIETVWGRGWRLTAESRAWFDEAVARDAASQATELVVRAERRVA